MADYSFSAYGGSGFSEASGVKTLQEYMSDYYQRTDDQLKADARALYDVKYDADVLNIQNQYDRINTFRDADFKKINTQYDKTGNSIDSNLLKRGLGRSSLISTRGVENENSRNAAIADKSLEYLEQENKLSTERQALDAEYAQNVENKYVELRDSQIAKRIEMLSAIASLQQSGYANYVNYLLNS